MANFCSQCGKPMAANANFCNQCGAMASETQKDIKSSFPKEQYASEKNMLDKRVKVIGKPAQRSVMSLKRWVILAAIGLTIVWAYVNMPSPINQVIASQPAVTAAVLYPAANQPMVDIPSNAGSNKIILQLDVVLKNKFVSFKLEEKNSKIPLLAYITNEGKIVTAISVCEPCNSQRFHITGETIVCNSCGTTWNLNTLEAISGSCGKFPPDAIPNTVVGSEIQIDKSIVQSWQRRG